MTKAVPLSEDCRGLPAAAGGGVPGGLPAAAKR